MAKLLPKKILDENMLDELTKYYKIDTNAESWDPKEFLEWECFSHPSLEYHDCNIRAKLLGGHNCTYCKHVPGRPCNRSCDFQHFCLSVFAWRLGIGGADISGAIKNNLYVLKNEELYLEVIKKFSNEEIEDADSVDKKIPHSSVTEDDIEEPVEEEEIIDDPNDPWLTIKEAAEYYGCTYCNIYNYVNKGELAHRIDESGKRKSVLIKQSVVKGFKNRPRKRKLKNKD